MQYSLQELGLSSPRGTEDAGGMKLMEREVFYQEIAITAAQESGKILRDYFRKPIQVEFKAPKDLVTLADIESEKKIRSVIEKHFPDHSIRGEELPASQTNSPYEWIIDPLDGTTNYAAGIPFFNVSIALACRSKVILAVIYDPLNNEMFHAEKNKGAFLNGDKIKVSNCSHLEDGVVSYSRSYHPTERVGRLGARIYGDLIPKIRATRQFGTAAIDFCYVASGRIDATVMPLSKPQLEHPAGCLIVDEAGGKSTDFSGKEWDLESETIVASNGKIHKALLKLLH